jgi:hypothetical protein
VGTKTAGKGLVLTLRSSTGTGAIRVAPRANKSQLAVEVLDSAGSITQIRLTVAEAEALADHLNKLIAPQRSPRRTTDEVTQIGGKLK